VHRRQAGDHVRCLRLRDAGPVPVDRVRNVIDVLIADTRTNSRRFSGPQLVGWFVAQTMKKLNGAVDPDEVF